MRRRKEEGRVWRCASVQVREDKLRIGVNSIPVEHNSQDALVRVLTMFQQKSAIVERKQPSCCMNSKGSIL